jgi:aminoglycoside phosphotransferase (APT) family kinase protein
MNEEAARREQVEALFAPLGPVTSFEPIEDGWTCFTYLVNGAWVAQLPRSEDAAASLRRQIDVLPELAREVSGAVPLPELVSRDPVAIAYRRIDGEPPTRAEGIWPERLGRFLYDLHMVPPEYVGMRARGPEAIRSELAATIGEIRARALPLLDAGERAALDADLSSFLDDDRNWRFAPCLAHNDLVRAHVLVTETGDLAGVIDWEEVGIGDPAIDFSWILGGEPDAGARALAAYGGAPDDRFLDRARFLWAFAPWHDVLHGLETDDPAFVRGGLTTVRERAGR